MIKLRGFFKRWREYDDQRALAVVAVAQPNGVTLVDLYRWDRWTEARRLMIALYRLERAGLLVGQLEPWDDGPAPARRRYWLTVAGKDEVVRLLRADGVVG